VPGRGDVPVFGLHDEQEIFEDETQCGGLNDSLTVSDGESDDIITLANPLAPGATIDVVFLLGVEQTGHFRFYVNIEALENSGPAKGPSPGRPASSTKRPIALTGRTAPKTPSTGSKPPSTSTTPVSTPANTPATRPGGTDGTTAPQRKTRPATPSVTPGVWRKLSPDATPETPPDAMPVSRHSRRDSN
jgi:hypothetical protein